MLETYNEARMLYKLAFIALGANLSSLSGRPQSSLSAALRSVSNLRNVNIAAVSRFYKTPAFPVGSGPDFVNACAAIMTTLSPDDLLTALHRIEADLGRVRDGTRWGARAIDLDLLGYEQEVAPDRQGYAVWRDLDPAQQMRRAPEQLVLPHPRLQDRSFVLVPLAEIAANWVHPVSGLRVAEMLSALPESDRRSVRVLLDTACETDEKAPSAFASDSNQ